MASSDPNPGPPPGRLVEAHEALDARVVAFYFGIAGLLLVLAGGLAYRQLIQTRVYDQSEKVQTERRVLLPGPRGNIYDRDGRLLVSNQARFSVVLYLDELQAEFHRESLRIYNNYKATGDAGLPSDADTLSIAHVSVVQAYLNRVNALLGRTAALDADKLKSHFKAQLMMPYTLVDDLSPQEFARLLEQLPVGSPLQLSTASARSYPYGSVASHVLGYVSTDDNLNAEDFPDADLTTFKLKGTVGRAGLEGQFDSRLQGQAGGAIYRVDPSGYKVNPPLEQFAPQAGSDLHTSLDLDLQEVAEQALGDLNGAAVALDVRTGEVLVLASKPDYDLSKMSPTRSQATVADIDARHAWLDLAVSGRFPPGSTFKILVSIAGLQAGRLDPTDKSVDCEGRIRIGNRWFSCDNGRGHHGELTLDDAISESCDIYFWEHGLQIGPDTILAQARRMHLDGRTGIELPGEYRSLLPDAVKLRAERAWNDGDTANISIGQGAITETPIAMACFAASIARGETWTKPTLLHDPNRPDQHTEPLGITPEQRGWILRGMQKAVTTGTAKIFSSPFFQKNYDVPGLQVAGKTGTAQLPDKTDAAWFICFAPMDNPQIAIAVVVKGDVAHEEFQGGYFAVPPAARILQAYFKKHPLPAPPPEATPAAGQPPADQAPDQPAGPPAAAPAPPSA
jgi:penicillin-binding protein 2